MIHPRELAAGGGPVGTMGATVGTVGRVPGGRRGRGRGAVAGARRAAAAAALPGTDETPGTGPLLKGALFS